VVSYLHDTYRVCERRACRVARIPLSTFRYESRQEPRMALRLRIREIAQVRVRYGYRKIRILLKWEGWNVGKNLVYRLYREEGLTLRHKPRRKRRPCCIAANVFGPPLPNEVWRLDFVANQLADGRRFRALTIMDVFTRESLAIAVGQRLKGEDVVSTLKNIRPRRGVPKFLFVTTGRSSPVKSSLCARITTNLGAAVRFPLSPTSKSVKTSWGLSVGTGYNFSPHHSVIGEFMWSALYPSDSSLQPIRLAWYDNSITGHSNLYTLIGNYRFQWQGRQLGAYFVGGGGWYRGETRRSLSLVAPVS
jgi:putative transposase